MPFYKRGFRYLIRKRTKTILLLLIFLFVNSMILSTNMILHATESTEAGMKEKTGAKVVCEISGNDGSITDKEAETIRKLAAVTSINRMGQQAAYTEGVSPVTGSGSGEPDNQKVQLLSFDDMDRDGPFADRSYRLTRGKLIGPDTQYGAVVNEGFADSNGLQTGDTFSLKADSGKTVSVKVIGEYLAGNESRQKKSTPAVDRMENQIYIDNAAYSELSADGGFYKVSVYTGQPELLDSLKDNIQGILREKADITTSDALYQQMKAPLTQITRVVSLMRLLTFFAGTAVVSLLLCMWMRSRKKEMAVFLSIGEHKVTIFLQALQETAVIFLLAMIASCGLGLLAADWMAGELLSSMGTGLSLQVSLRASDLAVLSGLGGGAVVIAVGLSLLPVLRANPKDLLSRMEG